jgi:hypothetical protein
MEKIVRIFSRGSRGVNTTLDGWVFACRLDSSFEDGGVLSNAAKVRRPSQKKGG